MSSPPAQDLLATLRPELKRFSSYEEAATAAAAILEQEAAAVARGLPPIDEEEDSDDEDDDRRAGGARAESIGAESEGATGSGGDGEDVDEYDRGGDDGAQANGDNEFEREYAALLQVSKCACMRLVCQGALTSALLSAKTRL